jgi:hypothetical protein
MLLLDDGDAIVAATLDAGLSEQPLQVQQRRGRCARFAQRHAHASCRIQHPRRHDRDDAGGEFYVDNRAARALLGVEPPNGAAIHWMPPVLDDDFLPDMGRMFGDSPWVDAIGCSSVHAWPASAQPTS